MSQTIFNGATCPAQNHQKGTKVYKLYSCREAAPRLIGAYDTVAKALDAAKIEGLEFDLKVGDGKFVPSLEQPDYIIRRVAKASDAV